jgi:hypothetical protein
MESADEGGQAMSFSWTWYSRYLIRNRIGELKSKRSKYGWIAFLPHRHIPNRIPAGDGWYCFRCGTRKAIVQKRGQEGIMGKVGGRHARTKAK